GMMDVRSLLDHFQEHTNVDVVAITDHDDITAGLVARDLAERHQFRFQVIVGCEVTTLSGHLIGLFLESPVPRLRSMEKTLQAIHRQGGLAIAPHPLSWLTFSLGERALRRAGQSQETGVYFDGIETANPSLAAQVVRERAVRLTAKPSGLPKSGPATPTSWPPRAAESPTSPAVPRRTCGGPSWIAARRPRVSTSRCPPSAMAPWSSSRCAAW
ncbi:MAG: hypothetical protein AAB289_07475, partial [Chloroflexota bacterium]